MGTPTVSILTSFFNAAPFLTEAVDSVLAQTFEDWELLLIDDGSTDGSTEIAKDFAARWPAKVRYLEHPAHANRGISASQNVGLNEAAGAYVAFLDADDVWLPHKLQEQVPMLESHPGAVMLYGTTNYWYSWTGAPGDASRDVLIPAGLPPDIVVQPPGFLVRMVRQEIPVPCPSDVLVRRDRALAVGGFAEEFRRIFTDQAFYGRLCLDGGVVVADRCWFKYRKHPNSAVAAITAQGRMNEARLAYLEWLMHYVDERGGPRELRRAVRLARMKIAHPRLWRLATHRVLPIIAAVASRARSLLRWPRGSEPTDMTGPAT